MSKNIYKSVNININIYPKPLCPYEGAELGAAGPLCGEGAVGGDDEVPGLELGPGDGPALAVVHQQLQPHPGPQVRLQLLHPVAHQARRAHHQRRPPPPSPHRHASTQNYHKSMKKIFQTAMHNLGKWEIIDQAHKLETKRHRYIKDRLRTYHLSPKIMD